MKDLERPGPTARQVSGADSERQWVLSVLAKRTYRILASGRCVLADEQLPLEEGMAVEGDPGKEKLVRDSDLIPIKPLTDVVILGRARSPRAKPYWTASVWVKSAAKHVTVVGDRKCTRSPAGTLGFTRPEPIDQVPLRYEFAFGGSDPVAERRFTHAFTEAPELLPGTVKPEHLHRCVYPRNPIGVGYIVDPEPEAVDQLVLPNLEDPEDLLTPDRLAIGHPDRWPILPLPQATEWMHYEWFPRSAFLGLLPDHDPETGPMAEVRRGFAPEGLMEMDVPWRKVGPLACNGASLGLRQPHLAGGEAMGLENVHPRRARFGMRLPADRPEIWTDGRSGPLKRTEPVIHTVLVEPDEARLSIVWRGSAPALRPYMPEELEESPFRVRW